MGLERPEGTWEGSLVVGLPLLSPGGHLRPCRQLVTEIAGKARGWFLRVLLPRVSLTLTL